MKNEKVHVLEMLESLLESSSETLKLIKSFNSALLEEGLKQNFKGEIHQISNFLEDINIKIRQFEYLIGNYNYENSPELEDSFKNWWEFEIIKKELACTIAEDLSQTLFSCHLFMDQQLRYSENEDFQKQFANLNEFFDKNIPEIKAVANFLYPLVIEDLNLQAALKSYTSLLKRFERLRYDYKVVVELRNLPKIIELILYRIYQDFEYLTYCHSNIEITSLYFRETMDYYLFEAVSLGNVSRFIGEEEYLSWKESLSKFSAKILKTKTQQKMVITIKIPKQNNFEEWINNYDPIN